MEDEIRKWILENEHEILKVNRQFVSIPSENRYPFGNELDVQRLVDRTLRSLDMVTDMFELSEVAGLEEHPAFLDDGRHYENRPVVVGTWKGRGNGRSLMFSGHVDTVPKGIDAWTVDPFEGAVIDGKQYGLGIFDMKGGMVAAMMAVKCLQELGYHPDGDVIIESVVDEEFGGANGTLACLVRGYEADAAIIPEPTNLAICPENEGGIYYRVSFTGLPGRGFSGEKVINPVFAAGRFLDIIRQYHEWRNDGRPVPEMFSWNPELATLVQVLRAGDTSMELSDRVPSSCSFDLWMQCFPGTTEKEFHEEFLNFIEPLVKGDEILSVVPPVIEKKIRFLPGTGISKEHPILRTLQDAGTRSVDGGLEVHGAAFACDAFLLNQYSDTPAVILGPSGGNGHAPNEFINISDFLTLVEVYARTIVHWCAAKEK